MITDAFVSKFFDEVFDGVLEATPPDIDTVYEYVLTHIPLNLKRFNRSTEAYTLRYAIGLSMNKLTRTDTNSVGAVQKV